MDQNTFLPQSNIRISEYDYDLPDSRIARYPLEQRDLSKLLIYRDGNISENVFSGLSQYLRNYDLLVVNNTRVIHSRLIFRKNTGALIEIFCLEPHEPSDYQLALQTTQTCQWKCIAGNLKKWKEGPLVKEIDSPLGIVKLEASKKAHLNNHLIVEFTWDRELTFAQLLELTGETPIPPYLNRESEEIDKERYQTVYSLREGSVAAPTAGLHFTDKVFEQLKAKNIATSNVTLHVGAGTFKPVQTEYVKEHEMHSEFFTVSQTTLENLMKNDQLVAVGTTSLRTLESLYWLGIKLKNTRPKADMPDLSQWEAYQMNSKMTYGQAMETVLDYMQKNGLDAFSARTSMMILPGYQIKSAKALVTNFHQPKSTLLLLVSAFIGSDWKKVYTFALGNNFRFLSYGDSSLLFRVL